MAEEQPQLAWKAIKTLHPHENELLRLCREKVWMNCSLRSQSHPHEAKPSEACLRGEGSTALSIALRLQAPRHVVHSLLQANIHQIGITHKYRGSVLHDALRHHVSDDVLGLLVQTAIEYQITMRAEDTDINTASSTVNFQKVKIQENRLCGRTDILQVRDELGRTVLHYIIERIKRVVDQLEKRERLFFLFKTLVKAYPEALQVMDTDGNSPLVLLLITSRSDSSCELETTIQKLVELVVESCPHIVNISGKLPRPWRFMPLPIPSSLNPVCSPLYYALLHGRSTECVRVLLNTHRQVGSNGCNVIVSQYYEVCLHIAVSTKASLSTLHSVLSDYREAVVSGDIYGLTPVDWLWFRHVLDWSWTSENNLEVLANRIVSRRRFFGSDFLDWHEYATSQIPLDIQNDGLPMSTEAIEGLQYELFQRLKIFVPAAAEVLAQDPTDTRREPWSLLHSTCFVPSCPLGMVKLVLNFDPQANHSIRSKDLRSGRYPLHYAAARLGYCVNLPVGVSRSTRTIQEKSPLYEILPRFPAACRVVDFSGQLPLHILIDAAKKSRILKTDNPNPFQELPMLGTLLSYYPEALDRRDGNTKLYPFQQAAVEEFHNGGASLTTIYCLLRRNPSHVQE